MYGLVNRAVHGLVTSQFGEEAWSRITARAGIQKEAFVAMETYDDQVTYRLVEAASEILDLEPAQVLEAFGEYWTTYTIEEGYGDLLSMMGASLDEFLDNLDNMHARIGESMPDLVPPSFERVPQADGSSLLLYESDREGLAPMVIGLLRGLGQRFDDPIDVELLEDDGSGARRFRIHRTH